MTDKHSLYDLLPAIHRMRDAERGYPLRSLLDVLGDQADKLADDTTRLYENWFIETCEEGLMAYFAELVGLELGPTLPSAAGATQRRRQVANIVAHRRRKGSFSVLEQLAADATGWPVRAIELGRLTLSTKSVRLPDVAGRNLIDMADGDALDVVHTPLCAAAPLSDVRRLSSRRTPGTANPGDVAVWLWRLVAETVSRAPATSCGEDSHYAFDQLGRDIELAVSPSPRAAARTPAMDLDVPTRITRVALERRLEDYYGPCRSLCVYRGTDAVPRWEILVADLGGWRYRTPPGHVVIDPELGRIAFPARHPPEEEVSVTYSRLAMGAIGGGRYERSVPAPAADTCVYRVGPHGYGCLGDALNAWVEEKRTGEGAQAALIEIGDDGIYEERLEIELGPGEQLEIRAAQGCRPILFPVEIRSNRPDHLRVIGPETDAPAPPREVKQTGYSRKPSPPRTAVYDEPVQTGAPPLLTLDGVWVAGHSLQLTGQLGGVTLRHCTLVPASGRAHAEDIRVPSLVVRGTPCPISICHSVIGRVRVESPEVGFDPLPLRVSDSVLDASDLEGRAVEGTDGRRAWVTLTLERVTVLGGADVHEVGLVKDSILTGTLDCERRQTGGVYFSYLPPGSRTPRRTSCQPDDVLSAVDAAIAHEDFPESVRERRRALEAARVAPRFDEVVFGQPAYARLAEEAAPELARGAHDEGELGAYHDLWQALRVADLHTRLQEFAPAGTDIGIRFAT